MSDLDFEDTRVHATPAEKPMGKEEARKRANAGAAKYRESAGMTDSDVQAAHTAAARHAPKSGIRPEDMNDPSTFQQLHSRKGRGLDAEVTDQKGKTTTTNRHRAQEGIIDAAVERVEAANQGKLTPQGQLDAAEEVRWRTENTPMDQRNVEMVRQSGPASPEKGSPVDPKSGEVIKEEKAAAKVAGEVGSEVVERLARAVPLVGAAVTFATSNDPLSKETIARAIAGEIPVGPLDVETIYDISAVVGRELKQMATETWKGIREMTHHPAWQGIRL